MIPHHLGFSLVVYQLKQLLQHLVKAVKAKQVPCLSPNCWHLGEGKSKGQKSTQSRLPHSNEKSLQSALEKIAEQERLIKKLTALKTPVSSTARGQGTAFGLGKYVGPSSCQVWQIGNVCPSFRYWFSQTSTQSGSFDGKHYNEQSLSSF